MEYAYGIYRFVFYVIGEWFIVFVYVYIYLIIRKKFCVFGFLYLGFLFCVFWWCRVWGESSCENREVLEWGTFFLVVFFLIFVI